MTPRVVSRLRPRLQAVLRSAGVRLALGYAAMFGLSALILVGLLWSSTLALLNSQVDAAIQADALGLAEQWQEGGPRGLLATIDQRLAGNIDNDAIYMVIDQSGDRVAGNLFSWPVAVAKTGPVYEIRVKRKGIETLARLHRYALPSGYSLLVGRDVAPRASLRYLLTQTLAWAILVIVLLSIGGAVVIQRLFRRMLFHVSETAASISAGDFSRRVKLSGRGDEFDRVAETINDMLDRIGRLMDGVRQVSNAIAHDLRTPITRARARLEDASRHACAADELRATIDRAIADLDGITAVFQALLRISEIEAGARRSAFTPLDLTPLLHDLAELYAAVAEERGLRLEASFEPSLPVRGDRELIQQAMTNLLDNALKFSPPGRMVRISGAVGPGSLTLSVADEGPGIPQADVKRATERFYRGETARHTPGFGLGLTLVRAVAQLHGGTLTLERAEPGLRAVITLPSTPQNEPAEGEAASKKLRKALPPIRQHEHVAERRESRV